MSYTEDVIAEAKARWETARLAAQHVDPNEGGRPLTDSVFRSVSNAASIIPDLIKLIEEPEAKPVSRYRYSCTDPRSANAVLTTILEVPHPPMGNGSGFLPPPYIEFFFGGGHYRFTYQGGE